MPRIIFTVFMCVVVERVLPFIRRKVAVMADSNLPHSTWIGVDLDGTLACYDGWKGPEYIGPPVAAMVDRVKGWLAEGVEVRVFTSRMSNRRDTAQAVRDHLAFVRALDAWCVEHVGQSLRPTCVKDDGMVELWDDRAVGVEFNTGAVRGGERLVRI